MINRRKFRATEWWTIIQSGWLYGESLAVSKKGRVQHQRKQEVKEGCDTQEFYTGAEKHRHSTSEI